MGVSLEAQPVPRMRLLPEDHGLFGLGLFFGVFEAEPVPKIHLLPEGHGLFGHSLSLGVLELACSLFLQVCLAKRVSLSGASQFSRDVRRRVPVFKGRLEDVSPIFAQRLTRGALPLEESRVGYRGRAFSGAESSYGDGSPPKGTYDDVSVTHLWLINSPFHHKFLLLFLLLFSLLCPCSCTFLLSVAELP